MVDGAAFTSQDANRGVVVGDSPIGISMFNPIQESKGGVFSLCSLKIFQTYTSIAF